MGTAKAVYSRKVRAPDRTLRRARREYVTTLQSVSEQHTMRTLSSPLLLSALCLVGAGCASKPTQEPPAAVLDSVCSDTASQTPHWVPEDPQHGGDPEIESLLSQRSDDPRLMQINREMYLSLRALQRLAQCQRPQSPELAVQSRGESGAGNGYSAALVASDSGSRAPSQEIQRAGDGGLIPARVPDGATVVAGSALAPVSGRKGSLSPGSGGGGNGATAPNISPGSDDSIVARRLRNAAEQEADPKIRAELWKEYTNYKLGTSTK